MSGKNKILNSCKSQGLVEFLLISPIFIFLVLCCIQISILFNIHSTVKLAAFNATRSFIVNINELKTKEAISLMKESAILTLTMVSPEISLNETFSSLNSFKKGSSFKNLVILSSFKGVDPLILLKKYNYASKYTTSKLEIPANINEVKRGSMVKVSVSYFYDLNVPIAGKVISKLIAHNKDNISLLKPKYPNHIEINKFAILQSEN